MAVHPKQSPARVIRSGSAIAGEVIGAISPGCRVVGVTRGLFSLLDLIEAVLDQTGPAAVTVATWTPGIAEMERVMRMLQTGSVSRFRLLVDRSFPGRHPKYIARVTEICGPESIWMTRTHAKFALISAGDYRITIRTSMNFNVNPRLEQFDLDDNSEIYALFDGVVNDMANLVPPGLHATAAQVAHGVRSLFTDDNAVFDGGTNDNNLRKMMGIE